MGGAGPDPPQGLRRCRRAAQGRDREGRRGRAKEGAGSEAFGRPSRGQGTRSRLCRGTRQGLCLLLPGRGPRQGRRLAGLNAVIEAHRAKSPRDPRLFYYSGQAHMLAKDYRAADKDFAAGLEQSTNRTSAARLLNNRLRARCLMGEALKAYRESEDKALTYRLLGPLLIEQKQTDDLAALVKAYRGVAPKEPTLGLWEAESHWLADDYHGAVAVLGRERDAILADPDNAALYEDRLVRSLVRLKKFDAAEKAAKHRPTATVTPSSRP